MATDSTLQRRKTKSGLKTPLVRLSLAVAMMMPLAEAAHAQLAVNCAQNIDFDVIAVCGAGGTLRVQPDGDVVSTNCVLPLGTPKQAICTVSNFSTNGSLQIQMTVGTININGPGAMEINDFNIATDAGGSTKTYTSAQLATTPLTFGIGADLEGNGGQTTGSYSGNLNVRVVFTP